MALERTRSNRDAHRVVGRLSGRHQRRNFAHGRRCIPEQEIGDPILGNRVIPLPVFLDAWPSRAVFVVIGTDFDRNTALLQPTTRPSARALYARQGPITDAELLDFGFTHADLF